VKKLLPSVVVIATVSGSYVVSAVLRSADCA
jgi:hypothetical protein